MNSDRLNQMPYLELLHDRGCKLEYQRLFQAFRRILIVLQQQRHNLLTHFPHINSLPVPNRPVLHILYKALEETDDVAKQETLLASLGVACY